MEIRNKNDLEVLEIQNEEFYQQFDDDIYKLWEKVKENLWWSTYFKESKLVASQLTAGTTRRRLLTAEFNKNHIVMRYNFVYIMDFQLVKLNCKKKQ